MSAYDNDPRVTWDEGAVRFTNPDDGHTVRIGYDDVFQVTAVVSRSPTVSAQTWSTPEPPGPEVTHVRDRLDVIWRLRDDVRLGADDMWDTGRGYEVPRRWLEILRRGPLVDASGEVA